MATNIPIYINIAQTADVMGVCDKTVRRHIAAGRLRAYRCGKRLIRVRIEDIEKLMREIPSARC
jgi:excisionase family DNA binding protein